MTVLVLADHDLGELSPATARVVAAAAELGPVDLLVAGEGIDAVALEAAKIAGVAQVRVAQDLRWPRRAPKRSPLCWQRSPSPTPTSSPAPTSVGRDVIPRLAARLDLMPVTDVIAILGPNRFDRPIYAGNAIETVTSSQAKHLLTVRASAFRPAAGGNAAPIEPYPTDR